VARVAFARARARLRAVLTNAPSVAETPSRPRADRRRDAFADALWAEQHRICVEIERLIPQIGPDFDLTKLGPDYPGNLEMWEGTCGLALRLLDRRKVNIEALAFTVAGLFWATLLLVHGWFAPKLDLESLRGTSGRARYRAFLYLWLTLYVFAGPTGYENSVPTRRASYEISKFLLPGAARDFDQDRDAMKHFARRLRKRFPAGKPAPKRPQ